MDTPELEPQNISHGIISTDFQRSTFKECSAVHLQTIDGSQPRSKQKVQCFYVCIIFFSLGRGRGRGRRGQPRLFSCDRGNYNKYNHLLVCLKEMAEVEQTEQGQSLEPEIVT